MTGCRRIVEFDIVELTEPVDDAPSGARAGVLELYADGTAMLEVVEPHLDAAARIVFGPIAKLRVVEATPPQR
jgi:hypothetical protein